MESSNTSAQAPTPVPVLGEGFSLITPSNASNAVAQETDPKKRALQLGKKKEEQTARSPSPFSSRAGSPQPMVSPSSPGRHPASPPRLHSPAESQIFERNVQEDSVAIAASPAIPSHIATENHIPPVLDASSMAITDDHLSPDTVEIVTHASHLPAAIAVTSSIHGESALSSPVEQEAPSSLDRLDSIDDSSAPSYAALDSADIRRLSFISFADVVHGEQAADGGMRDSMLLSSPGPRSPSPIQSPISPPLSAIESKISEFGTSPGRKAGPASPSSLSVAMAGATSTPTVTGEIAIETMRQVLRKTESGDLGAAARGSVSAL